MKKTKKQLRKEAVLQKMLRELEELKNKANAPIPDGFNITPGSREARVKEKEEQIRQYQGKEGNKGQGGCMLTILLGLGFISYFFYIL